MNNIPLLFAIALLIAAPLAGAEDESSDDLRYCLKLQSNQDIAKCAGEISAGGKGKPYSKEEVDKILSEEQASAPTSPSESPDTPEPGNQIKDLLLENDEGSGNQ
jgi:hypothetical protein